MTFILTYSTTGPATEKYDLRVRCGTTFHICANVAMADSAEHSLKNVRMFTESLPLWVTFTLTGYMRLKGRKALLKSALTLQILGDKIFKMHLFLL